MHNRTSPPKEDPLPRKRGFRPALLLLCLLLAAALSFGVYCKNRNLSASLLLGDFYAWLWEIPTPPPVADLNNDGVPDRAGILNGARAEALRGPKYKDGYYKGGYPPEHLGVCTDVIWRAFAHAGHSLKDMVDKDIRAHLSAYPRTAGKPDPNIDFRRVPNLHSFFSRHARALSTDMPPGDKAALAEWQPGDIVIFKNHIAVISDRRNADGVPYIIHNQGPRAREGDDFSLWSEKGVVAHFRFPPE